MVNEDAQKNVTEPDDIDALFDEINGTSPSPAKESTSPTESDAEIKRQADNSTFTGNEGEYKEAIDDFSSDYVGDFLTADFSDILGDEALTELNDDSNVDKEIEQADELDDIDALLAEVAQEKLVASPDEAVELHEAVEDDLPELVLDDEIDGDTLSALESEFDESTLSQLLNDEESVQDEDQNKEVKLSPDFTDSEVLADLLNEEHDIDSKDDAAIEDIEQLDSVEFDELLADIEKNSAIEESNEETDDDELLVELEIGDDLDAPIQDDNENQSADSNTDDFVNVDSILADSMEEDTGIEPYDKNKIDVGLDEFPEFTEDVNLVDVDSEDSSGLAAKLDLAKVYLEMDDNENAEVILKEVIDKGDEEQQAAAKKLLDQFKE